MVDVGTAARKSIARRYLDGESIDMIVVAEGKSKRTIREVLNDAEIEMRSVGRRRVAPEEYARRAKVASGCFSWDEYAKKEGVQPWAVPRLADIKNGVMIRCGTCRTRLADEGRRGRNGICKTCARGPA